MGRKSKLTDKQWAEISQRRLDGEGTRVLAREFGVSEAAIRQRLSSQHEEIKTVANQLVEADRAFKSLPFASQIAVYNLAEKLKSISNHLAGAAEYGAATAHRLSGLAHSEVQKIDDADPLKSIEALRGVSALTKLANDSAEIGLNLLKANKETVDDMNKNDDEPEPKEIVFQIVDARA